MLNHSIDAGILTLFRRIKKSERLKIRQFGVILNINVTAGFIKTSLDAARSAFRIRLIFSLIVEFLRPISRSTRQQPQDAAVQGHALGISFSAVASAGRIILGYRLSKGIYR